MNTSFSIRRSDSKYNVRVVRDSFKFEELEKLCYQVRKDVVSTKMLVLGFGAVNEERPKQVSLGNLCTVILHCLMVQMQFCPNNNQCM